MAWAERRMVLTCFLLVGGDADARFNGRQMRTMALKAGGLAMQGLRELMNRIVSLFAWWDLVCIALLKRVIVVTVNHADPGSRCSSFMTFASSIQASSHANLS